ncbi:MAG: GAF domain-containing protein [Nitrospirae bacterium]|nr:GAF domain-containing protein [Nitrospirota bacterium]
MEPKLPRGSSDPATAVHQRDTQVDTLNRLSAAISQSGSLELALQSTLTQLLALTDADMGSIHVMDAGTNSLKLMASQGVSEGFVCAERRIPIGDCLCGEAARTGGLIISGDLTNDRRLTRPACREEKFGSVVSIPLSSRERTLGILTVYAKRLGAFSETDQDLLVLVGRHIGVAVENAQLSARMRELAVVEERGLIAQEIHDGIAQSLAYLSLETTKLQQLLEGDPKLAKAELGHIRQVIKETCEDVRALLVDFRMKFKEGEGLADTLNRCLEEFSQQTAIRTQLIMSGDLSTLPAAVQVPVFRIIQEALSNVRKHAQAHAVVVTTAVSSSTLEVTVCDDGLGFEPEAAAERGAGHLGLGIMQERAAHLGGHLRCDSQPGRGTTLRLHLPLGGSVR